MRDFKRLQKRGKNPQDLRNLIEHIVRGESLDTKYQDHPLVGKYQGLRACHIQPDWLLIYELTAEELILIRTGSHADLFE
jgi:mRNA interferase YafQ